MATTGKKEYTLKINGINTAVKDVTTLEAAVTGLDTAIGKVNTATIKSTQATRERSKSLTEEEKAEQKLINAIDKVVQARSDANKAQIEANIAAREAQREITREIQIRQQAEGSVKQMGIQLTDLRNKYEELSKAERDDITVGGALLKQIRSLDAEYKGLRESTGNYHDSVGNYLKTTTDLSKGLANTFMLGAGVLGLFGSKNEELNKQMENTQKILGLIAIAQSLNNDLLKSGAVLKAKDIILTKTQAIQLKAKAAAEAASTKGTIAATAAQKVLNVVASANPYVILALALFAVGSALIAFASNADDARKEQDRLNAEIDKTERSLKQIKSDSDFNIAIAEASGASAAELRKLRLEAAKTALAVADANNNMVSASKSATKEMKDAALQTAKEAWNAYIAVTNDMTVQDIAERRRRAEKAKEIVKEQVKIEAEEIRAAEDNKLKLIQNANERAQKQTETTYNRQIEELRKRLTTEVNLTEKARQAINDQIVTLEKLKEQDLKKLRDEAAKKTLELERQVEDSRTALILGESDRRRVEINQRYDRQIEDYEKRLTEEKDLTENQQKAITELIANAQSARAGELLKLTADNLQARADIELSAIDNLLASADSKISEGVSRHETGLGLIDIKTTRDNLTEANAMLDSYISRLSDYQNHLTEIHQATLTTLQEGTPEYETELQRYARAVEDATRRITEAQTKQTENTKKYSEVQIDYYKELFEKIGEYANVAVSAISSVMDTWNMGLQVQLDDLNERLESISKQYEDAQKRREDAAANVEDIEARLQEASGGTTEALKIQLMDATHAREEAVREEQRIAKEQEKIEADVAKKEKQMRRNDLLSSIAQGIANTAEGVTKALSLIWPLNLVVAGIVGATGAAQVAIMTKQLTKLADGGEIKGPSHANGGVPIVVNGEYTHEAQGGEFMVNDKSYGANKSLVRFINDTPRTITATDLVGVVPGDTTPVIISETSQSSEDRIVEAIENIEMKPTVAVTDILDASDEVVTVRDLSGF